MSEYVVFFRDGSSVCVEASGYFDAIRKAKRIYPRKRWCSVQHAHQYA